MLQCTMETVPEETHNHNGGAFTAAVYWFTFTRLFNLVVQV